MAFIQGTLGNDLVNGSAPANLRSTELTDQIYGRAGNDTLFGLGGDDLIQGDQGKDYIDGGSGSDRLFGGLDDSSDTLFGRAGKDYVDGGQGNDYLDLGDDDDTAQGGSGNDTIFGGLGNDVLLDNNGNNLLDGGEGSDSIFGGFGEDSLLGGIGDDYVNGNIGDDTLVGGTGNDTLTGDVGTDFVSYASSTAGISINLAANKTDNDGFGNTDNLLDVENVNGSGFNDLIVGSKLGNLLLGNAGNDIIDGGTGNDTLVGGVGNDSLNGGDGFDQADYASSTAAVNVNLGTGKAGDGTIIGTAADGLGGTDTLLNIEQVRGSNFSDTLIGNTSSNSFIGGAGNDTINGGAGSDRVDYSASKAAVNVNLITGIATDGLGGTDRLISIEEITGTSFNDVLIGDSLNNIFIGGPGNDTIDGGAGSDRLDFSALTSGVLVNLATGTAADGQGGTDTLFSIEEVIGSKGGDTLIGDAANNLFVGGAGSDSIDGGGGTDRVDYSPSTAAVTVNLATGIASDGLGGTDTLSNIEEVVGSTFNDFLTGDSLNNLFIGGAGSDVINGGDGADTASYANSVAAVTVNLTAGTASDGFGDTDALSNIENVAGSNFNDNITGSAVANILSGGLGNDTLTGNAGNDTIDGGLGTDRVSYLTSPVGATNNTGVLVNLATGTASDGFGGTDTLAGVEEVEGSNYNDTITGSTGNNFLSGGSGNDSLDGGDGNDVLAGGASDDTLNGGNGSDRADYSLSLSAVTVDLVAGTGIADDGIGGVDTLIAIEEVAGSIFNDRLTGNALNNLFIGGNGNDTIDGADGSDRVDYSTSTAGVVVDLAAGTASDGFGGTDTLSNIENATGSAFADRIVGNAGNNALTGNGGRDTLIGGAGDDTLVGIGNSSTTGTVAVGSSILPIRGIGEVDILTGGANNDRFLLGGAGEFFYIGGGTVGSDLAIIGQATPTGNIRDFNAGDLIQVQKGLIYRVQQQGADTLILGTNSVSAPTFLDIMGVVVGATVAEVAPSLRDQTNANLTLIASGTGVQFFN